MPAAPRPAHVNVDNIRVAKLIGGTVADSQVIRGVVVQRDAEGSIKHVEKAKIAVFGCSIEAASPETRGAVVIKTAGELMAYNKGEEGLMEEAIKAIADAGAHAPRARLWGGGPLRTCCPACLCRSQGHRRRRLRLRDRHALH